MNQFVYCNTELCIGCGMCERQCIMAHYGLSMKEVTLTEERQRQRCKAYRTAEFQTAVHCRHCENAPCMAACPVKAIVHRDENMIFVDESKCIGCRECVLACPFGAVRMAPDEDGRLVATKCDLCRDTGDSPACVKGCPKKALTLVDEEVLRQMVREKQKAHA